MPNPKFKTRPPTREEVERMITLSVKPLFSASQFTPEELLRNRLSLDTQRIIVWWRREHGTDATAWPTRIDAMNILSEMYKEVFTGYSDEERHLLLAVAHAENAINRLF